MDVRAGADPAADAQGEADAILHVRAGADVAATSEATIKAADERVRSGSGTFVTADGAGVAWVDVACADGEDDLLEPSDPREPVGPMEDPWLEASGLRDLDLPVDPYDGRSPDPRTRTAEAQTMDAATLRALDARLAQIKQDAYSADPTRAGRVRGHVRPGQTEVIVHLTDKTLASGAGVVRAEGIGPLLASQLAELVGHGPYTVKPVIDLNDAVSVNAYEIPTRIRERVRLIHPVELFPYGTRETSDTIDLDHIEPYDLHGPTGQTSTTNLAPLGRFGHRVKTHARGWSVHRIDHKTLEWTTPHGFTFHVDPDGTHRIPSPGGTSRGGRPGSLR